MNLKYYLRGIGLGVIVTVVIMSIITGGRKESLTNEEIKERAKALGMIEDKVLTEYMEDRKQREEGALVKKETEAAEVTVDSSFTGSVQEEENAGLEKNTPEERAASDTEEDRGFEEGDEGMLPTGPTIFTVKKGELPYSIGERLVKSELISSAEEFETYMLNNGYDRKVMAGEYKIPAGANEETIARLITGQKVE